MKTITYTTHGTCARYIEVSGENGVLTNVKFYGGCNGNLQGISKLVTGMKYEDIIARLKGISCNAREQSDVEDQRFPSVSLDAVKKRAEKGDQQENGMLEYDHSGNDGGKVDEIDRRMAFLKAHLRPPSCRTWF